MFEPLASRIFDEVWMVRGRADGAAVLGHDAVGLLHAYEGELFDF